MSDITFEVLPSTEIQVGFELLDDNIVAQQAKVVALQAAAEAQATSDSVTNLLTAAEAIAQATIDAVTEPVVTVSGSSVTVDVRVGRAWDITLTADCAIVLVGAMPGKVARATITLRQPGGRAVLWPPSIRWPAGIPPAFSLAAGTIDLVEVLSIDGGVTWLGIPQAVGIRTDPLIQSIGGSWAGTTSLVLPAKPTEGNLLIAVVHGQNGLLNGPIVPAGWAIGATVIHPTNLTSMVIAWKRVEWNDTAGPYAFSSGSGGAATVNASLSEYAGVVAGPPDKAATATGASTSLVLGPTALTATPRQLVVAALGPGAAISSAVSWTNGLVGTMANPRLGIGRCLLTSQTAVGTTASWTMARNVVGAVTTWRCRT